MREVLVCPTECSVAIESCNWLLLIYLAHLSSHPSSPITLRLMFVRSDGSSGGSARLRCVFLFGTIRSSAAS